MNNFWNTIHSLRGIAALLVVIHHIPQYLDKKIPNYPFTFELGAIGVDIFFAISGFVMYQSSVKPGTTATKFILDRAKRVIPLYWFITIIFGLSSILLPSLFTRYAPDLEKLFKSLLFLPIYYDAGLIRPVLPMGWTLHYEMLFYTATAACLAFGLNRTNPALVSAGVLAFLSTLLACIDTDYRHSALQLLSPLTIEFLLGALIAHITLKAQARHNLSKISVLLFTAGILAITATSTGYESIGLDRLLSWGIGSALIVLSLTLVEAPFSAFISKHPAFKSIANKIGDSSYSLYLTHGISFSFSNQIFKTIPNCHWAVATIILLVGAIISGLCTHRFIETPIIKLLKK